MTQAIQSETQLLSEELCALLRKVDPSVFVFRDEAEIRAQVTRVVGRVRALVAAVEGDAGQGASVTLRERLRVLQATLERATPGLSPTPKAAWAAFQREVQPAYESLAIALRGMIAPPPTVRPTNYARSLFHLGSGLAVLMLLHLVRDRVWLMALSGSVVVWAWTTEVARRFSDQVNERIIKVFAHVAHPHERYRVNSATWYVTALFLLAAFSTRGASSIGILVLAIADPAAAFVGRRYGRIRLRAGRSLEGTLAFFVAGVLSSLAAMAAFAPQPLPSMVIIAVASAVAGALAELFSTRLDDNFTIPLIAAAAAALAGAA